MAKPLLHHQRCGRYPRLHQWSLGRIESFYFEDFYVG